MTLDAHYTSITIVYVTIPGSYTAATACGGWLGVPRRHHRTPSSPGVTSSHC